MLVNFTMGGGGLDFLRLGDSNSYVCALVFLVCGLDVLRLGVSFLTFGG